ncbi:MAG: hypothetical protein GTO63_15860 [Anaerolineae bacterium]|nr:hypothetical protein [Anaerolineae bacterium]NIN96302.1 hypothetical protein [Anaerolineae bacterium]NIQ79322.1 hypothetical protein [Anaerolineae bacterium]
MPLYCHFAHYLFKWFPKVAAAMTMYYLRGAYSHFAIYEEEEEVLLLVAADSKLLLTLLQQGALELHVASPKEG